jgi:preprotein translocase subunit YajC
MSPADVAVLAIAAPQQLVGLLPLVLVFLIFYFLLILPVRRRQRQTQQMLRELKNGDRVVTSGGLRGTIISLKDDSLTLRVPPDQVKLEVARSAVASVEHVEK